jgi:hypothetical protein
VAVGQQADEEALHHGALPNNDSPDFLKESGKKNALLLDFLLDDLDVAIHRLAYRPIECLFAP